MARLLPRSFARRRVRGRRPQSLRCTRLAFEPLEPRQMLAVLGLDVQVLRDDNGSPGAAIDQNVDTFTVGDTIWVRVRAEDMRSGGETSVGVIALPLDLTLTNPGLIDFTGNEPADFPDPIAADNPVLTPNFLLQRFVTNFAPETGVIEDLRGGALPALPGNGSAIGVGSPEEFSLLQFQAAAPGQVDISVVLAGSMSFADAAPLENDPSAQGVINIVAPSTASLSGFVYVDADNSGQREEDSYGAPIELGLPNVTITLFRTDEGAADPSTPLDQMTTGPGGEYLFEGLEPGTYRIVEEQPECFLDGQETLGIVLPGGDPRGVAGEDEFSDIQLAAGEDGVDYDFGELGLRAACINKRMFLASTPSPKEPVAERLGVPTETVLGTEGPDAIDFVADLAAPEPAMVVTVNGTEETFPISQTRMLVIDAKGGGDTVTLTVTEPDENVYMRPGYATLRHKVTDGVLRDWDYGVEVVNAEEVEEVDLEPEGNLTVIRDTPHPDTLTVAGETATLTTDDMARIARVVTSGNGLDRVMAITTSHDDTGPAPPIPPWLILIGDWQSP